ncbi:MAG: ASKHA domain-containing protein [Dehalococcoidia bacterium]|nr:ASKHA domain-containing protein [Dehalococcoidia bacterium]
MTEQTKKYKVVFMPDGIETSVAEGTNLLDAAIAAGVHINAGCGGAGTCGTCRVLIKTGLVDSPQTTRISNVDYQNGLRQACKNRIMSDIVVEIPASSRLETAVLKNEMQNSHNGDLLCSEWRFTPPIEKRLLGIPPPSLQDNTNDLARLLRYMDNSQTHPEIEVDLGVAKKLAATARQDNWRVTATLLKFDEHTRIINIESGDKRTTNYALVFDIGTTAVRGQLLDLSQGQTIAQATEYNKQISFGTDVIARITQCSRPEGLEKLQKAVVDTLNTLIEQMLASSKVARSGINHIVVTANTAMVHLLLALDPQYLRTSPYVPTLSSTPLVKAHTLGIEVEEYVRLYCVPSVASYVGGDIVSGIVGSGIHQRQPLTLYIDIGTNGEIVFGNSEWLMTAAASAGPTFEGGGIQCGMLATNGAIEDFHLENGKAEPVLKVIGGGPPLGICGSGIINLAATLLKNELITQAGRFNMENRHHRLRIGENGAEYVLVYAAQSGDGKDIVFSEIDMLNLIRSKAALYAGYHTLVSSVDKKMTDIEQVVISGTFGNHLNIENAIAIGLLPDLPRHKFSFIGNGALLGARLIAFSNDVRNQSSIVASMMTSLELSENTDFMSSYTAAMFLPHTEAALFPSVKIGNLP